MCFFWFITVINEDCILAVSELAGILNCYCVSVTTIMINFLLSKLKLEMNFSRCRLLKEFWHVITWCAKLISFT